jgi:hypothetical protein
MVREGNCSLDIFGRVINPGTDVPVQDPKISVGHFRIFGVRCAVTQRRDGTYSFVVTLAGVIPLGHSPERGDADIDFNHLFRLEGINATPACIASLARDLMVRAVVHELDEHITINGKHPFEPHAGPYKRDPW